MDRGRAWREAMRQLADDPLARPTSHDTAPPHFDYRSILQTGIDGNVLGDLRQFPVAR